MKIAIEIEADNAAFDAENFGPEFARILRDLAARINHVDRNRIDVAPTILLLRDINGNRVGECVITEA